MVPDLPEYDDILRLMEELQDELPKSKQGVKAAGRRASQDSRQNPKALSGRPTRATRLGRLPGGGTSGKRNCTRRGGEARGFADARAVAAEEASTKG